MNLGKMLSKFLFMPITLVLTSVILLILLIRAIRKLTKAMDKDTLNKVVLHTKKWEGGLSKDSTDTASSMYCPTPLNGVKYHTNKGVTYKTWVSIFGKNADNRFLKMSNDDWFKTYQKYWNGVKASEMKHVNIGIACAQFAWGSGIYGGSKFIQKSLNKLGAKLKVDGKIGAQTIAQINKYPPSKLFNHLMKQRELFFYAIVENNPSQAKFLKGWLNRLNDFKETFEI
jgi:lysozyme family protein